MKKAICGDIYSIPIFARHITSLKETSKDCSKEFVEYMTNIELDVFNFDDVKTDYANNIGLSEECAKSVDCIIPLNDRTLFVEFKNGKVNNSNIKDKLKDSLLIYLGIIDKSLNVSQNSFEFIVVYNADKINLPNEHSHNNIQCSESRNFIAKSIVKKAGEELILFGIDKYKTLFFKDIHTYSKEEFDKYLLSLV